MNHPNIIKLKEVIRVVNEAYFVFEYIEKDLYKLMTDRKEKGEKLEEHEIRYITKQLAEALLYVHKQGFFHRDMKPENILISNDLTIKIIDFGISREIRSKPPYTEYISTRWYRAPELLFKYPSYSAAVDVFAVGCIVAEMYLNKPLFQGNSEMDQISKIVSILGSPSTSWPDGLKQATKRGIGIPEYPELPLSAVIPNCPSDALSFIGECLRWDPAKRITSAQMVNHPFLAKDISELKL
jgi:protein kinase